MIMPLSIVISSLFRFGIQLFIFMVFFAWFYFNGAAISLNKYTLLFPIMVLLMGMIGLGLGMIISSMVTKYRDLKVLVSFGLQLLMYLSAVMYPVSYFSEKLPEYVWLVKYNPLTIIIETVRFQLLNVGTFNLGGFVSALLVTIVILLIGILIFNKAEKNFIDTV